MASNFSVHSDCLQTLIICTLLGFYSTFSCTEILNTSAELGGEWQTASKFVIQITLVSDAKATLLEMLAWLKNKHGRKFQKSEDVSFLGHKYF